MNEDGTVTRNDALMTPAEVAALFSVCPKTVSRWAQTGKLTAFRTIGGHRRFRRSDVETAVKRFLEGLDEH